jgi:hypothetical protein
MLTLLKQARAFGLGIVLATQNPVDLDYKGLANCGTWWLGRLQTERDRLRVLDGLQGATTTAGRSFDRARTEALLAGLPRRTFLMNDVHEAEPVLFQTRWTMSYLRGPLTRPQIRALTEARRAGAALVAPATPAPEPATAAPAPAAAASSPSPSSVTALSGQRPLLPPEVKEVFIARPGAAAPRLVPRLLCDARVHYVDARCGVDLWQPVTLLAPVETDGTLSPWEQAQEVEGRSLVRGDAPSPEARFAELPAAATRAKGWPALGKSAAEHLYRNRPLRLLRAPAFRLVSRPGESGGDFRARIAHAAREARDAELDRLRKRWEPKLRTLQDRERRAQEKVRVQQAQYEQSRTSTVVAIGGTLLGALFGRRLGSVGNVGRAGTAVRGAARAGKEKEDIAAAQVEEAQVREQLAALTREFAAEAQALREAGEREPTIEDVVLAPRKADTVVESLVLAWVAE